MANRILTENGNYVIAVGEPTSAARMKAVYPDTLKSILETMATAGYTQRSQTGNLHIMMVLEDKFYHVKPEELPDLIAAAWFYHEHENRL